MRSLLFLLSLALALPSIALAAVFLILGHGISAGSLLGFFAALLEIAVWLLPWGLLAGAVALITLILGGFSARWRWLASACVGVLVIGSSVVVLMLASERFSLEQLAFFVPAAMSAALGIGLAISEWSQRNSSP